MNFPSTHQDYKMEFVVFALEVDELLAVEIVEETLELELLALESEEETLELEPIVLESVDFAGLDTTSSSEVIGTVIVELSDPSDFILLSTLEKSNPQFEQ